MNATPEARYHAIALRPAAETPTLRLRPKAAREPLPMPRARGTVPPPAACSTLDARMLAILEAPLRATETPTEGFNRKERALGNLFVTLAEDEAHALHRRLVINFTCDLVARKFAGLAVERKERLLAFLENHCCH